METIGGIYKIVNLENGKIYIGCTYNFEKRKKDHFNALSGGRHNNEHLQFAYNKYGCDSFSFEIIEVVTDREKLIERENYYIKLYNSNDGDYGYNIRDVPENNRSYLQAEETKKKIARKKVGKSPSEETRKKISDTLIAGNYRGTNSPNYGKKQKPESVEKTRLKNVGRKASPETIIKLKARRHTEEDKKRRSIEGTGEGNHFYGKKHTEESKKKMSDAKKGKYPTEEQRQKMKDGRKPYTDEDKKRISETGKNTEYAKSHRLPIDKYIEIKSLLEKDSMLIKDIAEIVGVCRSTVTKVRDGGYEEYYGGRTE